MPGKTDMLNSKNCENKSEGPRLVNAAAMIGGPAKYFLGLGNYWYNVKFLGPWDEEWFGCCLGEPVIRSLKWKGLICLSFPSGLDRKRENLCDFFAFF